MSNLRAILLVGSAIGLAACGADDVASPGDGVIVVPAPTPAPAPAPAPAPTPTPTPPGPGPATSCPVGTASTGEVINGQLNCSLSGTLLTDLTLEALPGVIYSITGGFFVGTDVGASEAEAIPGGTPASLTIEPGVVIFGTSGSDFLAVNRGSQIFSNGEADNPIIFTSRTNVEGTATASSVGDWGGVVIAGQAPVSDCLEDGAVGGSDDCEGLVEGLTANVFFGGDDPDDSSGSITFTQVRFSGFEVTPGNELNGITLAGVGAVTTFNNVQVANSSDDGIEWFGGTVNGKFLALTGNTDDSIDSDVGYTGVNQFVIVSQSADGDRAWEADSNGDEANLPRQDTALVNFTFLGNSDDDNILLRGSGDYALVNGIILNPDEGCIDVDGEGTVAAEGSALEEDGPPVFASLYFTCAVNFNDDDSVDPAVLDAIFAADPNNAAGPSTLLPDFSPGANEAAVTAFDFSTAAATDESLTSDFLEAVDFIGALSGPSDTNFDGWTCDLPGQPACIIPPATTPSDS
ncbi:MAG: hypothetical protein AAGD40_04120 [Pseudomonadota bacterium]